jgi:putative transposase
MGRPLRLKAPNLTFHIMSRTNGRKLFMKKKRDQKMLCVILRRILLKHQAALYAFTPMMNHFHMLVHTGDKADISRIMCEFKVQYAKYYNKKYGTSNHFWGNRFRSTIVEDDRHALICLRYIDRNPVKSGLVDHPGKWLFSSFHAYAYGTEHEILPLELHPTYLALAKLESKRHQFYQQFVLENNPEGDELHGRLPKLQIFGSAEFELEIKQGL